MAIPVTTSFDYQHTLNKVLFFFQSKTVIFLFLHENICYTYSLEVPQQRPFFMSIHKICFCGEISKIHMDTYSIWGYEIWNVC